MLVRSNGTVKKYNDVRLCYIILMKLLRYIIKFRYSCEIKVMLGYSNGTANKYNDDYYVTAVK